MLLKWKIGTFSLPNLLLETGDLKVIQQQLDVLLKQNPNFLQGAAVVVQLPPYHQVDLEGLHSILRGWGATLVGVTGESAASVRAQHPHLPFFSSTPSRLPNQSKAHTTSVYQTLSIDDPVRSGQKIYARHANLVVFQDVGNGAELVADGNIYVYGRLRGRALAGASGDEQTHICVRHLQSELIAVAGVYWDDKINICTLE